MNTLLTSGRLVAATILVLAISASGCATAKRTAITGLGTVAGAAAGYAIAPDSTKAKAIGTAAGALVGAAAATVAQGRSDEDYQQGVDDGYNQASSDDVKRLYWAKQALEKKGQSRDDNGVVRYYIFEDEGTTKDGRKLAPEKVAIEVYEPKRQ